MARKSNKTAHVLNLLAAGHDSAKNSSEETEHTEPSVSQSAEAPASEAPSPVKAPEASVSVIDTTEHDPVADLIHQKLLEELEDETIHIPEPESIAEPEPNELRIPTPEAISEPEPKTFQIPEPVLESEPEVFQIPEPIPESEPEVFQIPEPDSELTHFSEPEADTIQTPESVPEPEALQAAEPQAADEPNPQPAAAAEPEPDFVTINVIERIVRDKVIYFMREFDVCTCDRCKADTIALALNGLPPKYIVTMPAAVEPLLSFYTNKYISTVTVELTKACIAVKENPRH